MKILGDTVLPPMPDDERYMDEREISDMQARRKHQDTYTRRKIAKVLEKILYKNTDEDGQIEIAYFSDLLKELKEAQP